MPRVTVAINTWRLGGFDCFIPALARQSYKDFEVVIADELHRWRAPYLSDRLKRLPFPVKHLPVTDSLFPVCSTMRAGNTILRAASGEIVVHLCDYSIPPADFLAAHVAAYDRHAGKIIGISPCLSRKLKPEFVPFVWNGASVWDMIERCASGFDGPSFWSVLNPPANAILEGSVLDLDVLCAEEKSNTIEYLEGAEIDEPFDEWACHFKSNSFSLASALEVDGWEEDYDGAYIYGDIDLALRLMAVGAVPRYVDAPVEILDAHPLFLRLDSSSFRVLDAERILTRTRENLERAEVKAVLGLSVPPSARRPKVEEAKSAYFFKFRGTIPWKYRNSAVCLTLLRPWLETGRVDLRVIPQAAFAWKNLEPNVLIVTEDAQDVGEYKRVLRDRCSVVDAKGLRALTDLRFQTVVLHEPGVGVLNGSLEIAERIATSRIIITGDEATMDDLENRVGDRLTGRRVRPGADSTIHAVILNAG